MRMWNLDIDHADRCGWQGDLWAGRSGQAKLTGADYWWKSKGVDRPRFGFAYCRDRVDDPVGSQSVAARCCTRICLIFTVNRDGQVRPTGNHDAVNSTIDAGLRPVRRTVVVDPGYVFRY